MDRVRVAGGGEGGKGEQAEKAKRETYSQTIGRQKEKDTQTL